MGNYAISKELEKAYISIGIKNYELNTATAKEFHDALKIAKSENDYGAFVTLHDESEYEGMELLLTNDKKAGVAITTDNNIISVFKGDSAMNNVISTLLPAAIEFGGNKLDNYNDDKLSLMYSLYGFIPVSKTKFDPNFAPEDWNYERDGMPDILFWIHNGDEASEIVRHLGDIDVYDNDVKEFESYSDAGNYRDSIIKKMKETDL